MNGKFTKIMQMPLLALSVALIAPAQAMTPERGSVDKIVAGWAERPRLGANQMIAKYGMPQEATDKQLVWHSAGPFKKITVFNLETPHDFPMPHVDYMEHTIAYNVPQNKVADLIAFDGSSTINRTTGELSARCDLEGHNVLTLNLDHDIVTGKHTVQSARKAFGEIVTQDIMGKQPAYVKALQFQPEQGANAAFSDTPVIPGAPVRSTDMSDAPASTKSQNKGDAEVLATLVRLDINEVNAAAEAQNKKLSGPVMAYAKMLHTEHGANAGKTMQLGQKLGVTPVETPAVESLGIKGAGVLANMVLLDGAAFERAYLDAVVKDHAEVLAMIDGKLMSNASHAEVKAHLKMVRTHIAAHHEQAKKLHASLSR